MRSALPPSPAAFFRSEAQAHLLARLLLHPGDVLTLKELTAVSMASRATTARELARLCGTGVVRRVRVAGVGAYQAATESPLFPALSDLAEKTMGVEQIITRSLAQMESVEAAAIFGSWAKGNLTEHSDIDVLIVGSPDRHVLSEMTLRVSAIAGREVNASVWTADEMDSAVQEGRPFIRDVLSGPLRLLVGDFSRWMTT